MIVGAPAGPASAQQAETPAAADDVPPSVHIERPAANPNTKLQKVLGDEAARLRVKEGRVHPRLHDIQRAAQETFDPPWELVEDHPRQIGSMGNTAAGMGKSILRSWMVQAPRYATNQSIPSRPRHPAVVRPGEEDDPTLLDHYDEHTQKAIDNSDALMAEVCLDLAPGTEATATVVRTSGRGKFDRLARQSALSAVRARPYPRDAPKVRACYRYTAHFATIPPVPWVGCTFEKSSRTDDRCVYPLKRLVTRDVELISVK